MTNPNEPFQFWLVDESVGAEFWEEVSKIQHGSIVPVSSHLRLIEVRVGHPSRVITFAGVSEATEPAPETATAILLTSEGLKIDPGVVDEHGRLLLVCPNCRTQSTL